MRIPNSALVTPALLAREAQAQNSPERSSQVRVVDVFGCTGSIGTSTLSIVRDNPERFKVGCLACFGQVEKLVALVAEFSPEHVAICDETRLEEYKERLSLINIERTPQLHTGVRSLAALAARDGYDIHVAAIPGLAGLSSIIAAVQNGKLVALANKEGVVSAAPLIETAIKESKGNGIIVPVDSEHSAIFQCLAGNSSASLRRIILTASGGPFLRTPFGDLGKVTPDQAVNHPRWKMGRKISIDSATMMNKALEVLEASRLFGLPLGQVEALIHPESIVHGLVEFDDGAILAHLSVPDMRGAIGYALGFPASRVEDCCPKLDLSRSLSLNFESVDPLRFPAIELARAAYNMGESALMAFQIANEVAVHCFEIKKIPFTEIVPMVRKCLESFLPEQGSNIDHFIEIEHDTRRKYQSFAKLL